MKGMETKTVWLSKYLLCFIEEIQDMMVFPICCTEDIVRLDINIIQETLKTRY